MANSKSGYNAVGQAPGPRRNTAQNPSSVLYGAARSSSGSKPRQGNRIPPAPNEAHRGLGEVRPGGTKGQSVTTRKGAGANISRPGR